MSSKTLTRADLAEAVVEKVGLPRNESQDLVERVLDEISGSLAAGDAVKLSAAWLIERAGFSKGTTDGPVGISTRHALALVNRGGATASEVWAFARRVRASVEDLFGVRLVAEPVLLGFSDEEAAALR